MPIDNQIGSYPTIPDDQPLLAEIPSAPPESTPVDPNNPPWGLGGALLVWFASLLLQLFIPVIFIVPYALKRGVNPASPAFAKQLAEISLDKTGILLQVAALLPTHLLTFVLVWALVTRLGKFPFLATIGWSWPPRLRFWRSVVLGALLFAMGTALAHFAGAEKETLLEQIINSSLAARYSIAFLAVFTAPFIEEFVYRGVLFAAVQKLAGSMTAGLLTLGLFTLIHVPQYWPNVGVLAAIGFLSVALTIVRAKTGRLLPCIVIHFVFNGIQSVFLLVEPYVSTPPPVPDPAPALMILNRLGLF